MFGGFLKHKVTQNDLISNWLFLIFSEISVTDLLKTIKNKKFIANIQNPNFVDNIEQLNQPC